jgi:energy-coupling factor transporter transmembrane protein EcfT
MSLTLIVTITIALINIVLARDGLSYARNAINVIGLILIILALIYIIIFIFHVSDPYKFDKSNKILLSQLEGDLKNGEGDIVEFLSLWNKLEKLVDDISIKKNLLLQNNNMMYNRAPSFMQRMKNLLYKQDIDINLIDRIDKMRRTRNVIVHGEKPSVQSKTITELKDVIESITNILHNDHN